MYLSIRFLLGGFSLAAFLSQAAAALGSPVSIEAVMEAPYPSSLVASTKGQRRRMGVRYQGLPQCVAVARRACAAVTPYTLDDGFDIGDLAWRRMTSQLRTFAAAVDRRRSTRQRQQFARGSCAAGSVADCRRGRRAAKTGRGPLAEFFTRRQRLVFADKNEIMSTALATDTGAAVDADIVDQGRIASMTFSPDGKKLAFVSAPQATFADRRSTISPPKPSLG